MLSCDVFHTVNRNFCTGLSGDSAENSLKESPVVYGTKFPLHIVVHTEQRILICSETFCSVLPGQIISVMLNEGVSKLYGCQIIVLALKHFHFTTFKYWAQQ